MNEVKLSGTVLNCYIHAPTDALIIKLAVPHNHYIGKTVIGCEPAFTVIMNDADKIKNISVSTGEEIMITGYLHLDIKVTKSTKSDRENIHKIIKVFATDIKKLN